MNNLNSIILRGVFTLSLILCVSSVKAQEAITLQGIEKITEIDQIPRFGTKKIPADIMENIVGYYRNIDNDNGLPFVQIKENF